MTKETILKRLLLENHITVEELIILGTKDIYETRDPQSFPPKQKKATDYVKEQNDFLDKWFELERKNKNNLIPGFYYSTTPYHLSQNIVSSKL